MKAIGLLLCLTIAGATASIFRRAPDTDALFMPPLDFMPEYTLPMYQQYQQTHENQKRDHNSKHNHHNHYHHSNSASHESSHESDETKEKKSEEKDRTTNWHHYKNWKDNSENRHHSTHWKDFSTETKNAEIVPLYGDAIVWNGMTIAIGANSVVQTKEDIKKIFGDAEQTLKHIPEEMKKKLHEDVTTAINNDNQDAHLNATQLIQKHKYPVEEHVVKTDDGYNLTLFRIPPKTHPHDVLQKPTVLLMHGLLGSADDWLLQDPDKSLAFMLADAGYDVWLGNTRGSKYSRHHASKHPALKDFWQFSNDEIALHDLPAMIDHALRTSGQDKLHYVGHGHGTTTFFALTSEKPEYTDKITTMHALAPMVYMSNVRSPLMRMIAPTSTSHKRLHEDLGHGAFEPTKELIHTTGGEMCQNAIGCESICSNINFVMSGVDTEDIDPEMIHVITTHLPAGTSTRVIKHFGQGVASHEFKKYDYGTETNKKVYGTPKPPKYELHKVQVPVWIHHSEEDWLAHPKDVERLAKELPIVKAVHKVPEKHFTHMDFQFSKKAPETVHKKVLEAMQTATS